MNSVETAGPSEKPHRCGRCGRRFARSEHLQRHSRTHTKEKPFTCFCGQSFTRTDLLKRHRQRVHSSINALSESAPIGAASGGEQDRSHNAVTAAQAPILQTNNATPVPASENPHMFSYGDPDAAHSPLHGFAAFMESIGMVPDWESLDFLDIEPFPQQPQVSATEAQRQPAPLQDTIASVPPRWPDPSGQAEANGDQPGSIPTMAEVRAVADAAGSEQALTPIPWKLTQLQWQTLSDNVKASLQPSHQFVLPSRPAMSRYLQAYINHFHKHYPMIHLPTYCPGSSPIWLTLAIAAVGAQCRFESKNGHSLYSAARAAALEQRRLDSLDQLHNRPDQHRTAMIQTLVLLMVYGAWDAETKLLDDALDLQSVLSSYIRASLRDDLPPDDGNLQWRSWIHLETHRRTILIVYAYLVIQSMTYDLPPVVMTSEIQHLRLPCGSSIWEAQSEHEWKDALHRSTHTPVQIKDALRHLLRSHAETDNTVLHFSTIGSFVILQALIQRVYLVRQLDYTSSPTVQKSELETLQLALVRWKTVCQRTVNSTLDSRHTDSSVPFTSAGFLALAFARLHVDLGPYRQLHTRDPKQIAAALRLIPAPQCSPDAVPALLHAAHALSVPVLMGVDSVLGSDTLSWSCEHSLCGLEAGVFLWKWLQSAGESLNWDGLNVNEKGIVSWVLFSISETLQSVEAVDLGLEEGTVLSQLSFPKLGILVLKIWARIFSSNTSWAITNELGSSLKLLAEAVELDG